jgi:aminoglycoside 6'-N-acetyltransferase
VAPDPSDQPGLIRGRQVTLRPLVPDDRPRMREILAQPSVALRWLGTRGLDGTTEDLFGPDQAAFAILAGPDVVGYIQFDEEDEPDYRHASIDVFLDDRWQGRGLGTDAVRTLASHLIHQRGHHRVTIDPAADNAPAIRAYEKAGFRAVGRMRRYERGPDGTWHDGLLMDLLAEDAE